MHSAISASLPGRSRASPDLMIGLFSGSGKSYDSMVACSARMASSHELKYSTTDWYRIAQEQLTGVALAVQRQDELDFEALSALATGIADELKRSDQLLVQAMSGPAGPPLITNLVNVAILATKVGAGLGYHGKSWSGLPSRGSCTTSASLPCRSR